MNILYCGDCGIEDGLVMSVLSLLRHVNEPLHVYVLSMSYRNGGQAFIPVNSSLVSLLDSRVKEQSEDSFVRLFDLTDEFCQSEPLANLGTRFTPYCMLRLYDDLVDELPKRLLYLDHDVICMDNPADFYHENISDVEYVGVLDYYGRWVYSRNIFRPNYINSGVMLLNMERIRITHLFERCRRYLRERRRFLPDQAALNALAVSARLAPRRFNDQRRQHADTVFRHFSTTWRLLPLPHTVTVKPWDLQRLHSRLRTHALDDLHLEYQDFIDNYIELLRNIL